MPKVEQSPRRRFEDHFQATFGAVNVRKLRRRGLLGLGICAVLMTGAASADWRVYDQSVERVLEQIRDDYIGNDGGSVSTQLNEMNDRLAIAGDDLSTAEDSSREDMRLVVPNDEDVLPGEVNRPTQATNVDLAARCPAPRGSGTGIPQQQYRICQETYQTEIAQYRFSLEMYRLAETRNTKLRELVQERNSLDENDYGKMQENTNKLVALQVQMDNDRDRYQTYMQAYLARTNHLAKSKELLAETAMSGNRQAAGGPGGIPGGVVGGAVLITALEAVGHSSGRSNPFE